MCGPISQATWKQMAETRKTSDGNPAYIITEYTNPTTQDTGLLVASNDGWFYTVLDADGYNSSSFDPSDYGEDFNVEGAREAATSHLAMNGFQPKEQAEDNDPLGLASTRLGMGVYDKTYGGKTIREWLKVGEQNENTSEHVHPEAPGDGASAEEKQNYEYALMSSLTTTEGIMMMMQTIGALV